MQMNCICLFCAYAARVTLISVCRQSITEISQQGVTSTGSIVYFFEHANVSHTAGPYTEFLSLFIIVIIIAFLSVIIPI